MTHVPKIRANPGSRGSGPLPLGFLHQVVSRYLDYINKKPIRLIRELLERGAIEAAKKEIDIHAQSQNIHQNSTAGITLSNNLQNLKLFDELQTKLGKYYIDLDHAPSSCLIQAAEN